MNELGIAISVIATVIVFAILGYAVTHLEPDNEDGE